VSPAENRRSRIRSLVRRKPSEGSYEADRDDGLSAPEVPPKESRGSPLVDSAIYVNGERVASPDSLPATFESLRQHPDGMAWIGLYRPEEQEVQSLASEFQLHPLAVEDAIHAHQRPKIERHDETLFVVLRPARYLDDTEEVEFGEIHVFVGPRFVITVRHSEAPEFGSVRHRLESEPEILRRGPEAVLYALLDKVVEGTTRSSQVSITTSTRSRSRCSAAIPRCPAASTSCPGKWPTSSAPPGP
jgi:magnesium transporter